MGRTEVKPRLQLFWNLQLSLKPKSKLQFYGVRKSIKPQGFAQKNQLKNDAIRPNWFRPNYAYNIHRTRVALEWGVLLARGERLHFRRAFGVEF